MVINQIFSDLGIPSGEQTQAQADGNAATNTNPATNTTAAGSGTPGDETGATAGTPAQTVNVPAYNRNQLRNFSTDQSLGGAAGNVVRSLGNNVSQMTIPGVEPEQAGAEAGAEAPVATQATAEPTPTATQATQTPTTGASTLNMPMATSNPNGAYSAKSASQLTPNWANPQNQEYVGRREVARRMAAQPQTGYAAGNYNAPTGVANPMAANPATQTKATAPKATRAPATKKQAAAAPNPFGNMATQLGNYGAPATVGSAQKNMDTGATTQGTTTGLVHTAPTTAPTNNLANRAASAGKAVRSRTPAPVAEDKNFGTILWKQIK
jgi:hypothetical protein